LRGDFRLAALKVLDATRRLDELAGRAVGHAPRQLRKVARGLGGDVALALGALGDAYAHYQTPDAYAVWLAVEGIGDAASRGERPGPDRVEALAGAVRRFESLQPH